MDAAAPHAYARDALTGLTGAGAAVRRIDGWREHAGAGAAGAGMSGDGAAGDGAPGDGASADRAPAEGAPTDGAPPIHALLLSLQRFDTVALAYGHATGDAALTEAAARITRLAAEEIAGEYVLARPWGGTFLLASYGPISRERWQWLGESLADAVALPIGRDDGGVVRLSPKLVLIRGLPREDGQAIVDRLKAALGRLENEPARRLIWADGGTALARRGMHDLEVDLLSALDRDEIDILYQPQFACDDERLVGAEALARWRHPELGRIGGANLFAVAERAGQTAQLSRHVARLALREAADWPPPLRLSLNVTPAEMAEGRFAQGLATAIAQSGFDADRLTVEITEQVLLADLDRAAASLAELVGAGVRIALDDFGAGFCNFRYLKLLPLHYLKLDRSMVEGIVDDPRDLAVLRGIVTMAKALGLHVIAEGIENAGQARVVAAEGCEFYQGFLKAQPLAPRDMLALATSGWATAG